MLKKLLRNKLKIAIVLLLVLLLSLIRGFETKLFYDPFSSYFQNDYLTAKFPEFDYFRLFLGLFFRYFLNTIVSLGIIYVLFWDLALTKFAGILYLIFFVIFILAFFILIKFTNGEHNFVLFYVRRFLIQPILLLLFIPAFFYQKNSKASIIS